MKTITNDIGRTGKIAKKALNRRPKAIKGPDAKSNGCALHLKSLLVPIDYSEPSNLALDFAGKMAERFGAQLELVHVIAVGESAIEYERGVTGGAQELQLERRRLNNHVAERVSELVSVHCDIRVGRSYEDICQAARESASDIIVMGTHGRTGLKRIFLGSTAERVVRMAPCPVLVVRDRSTRAGMAVMPSKILVPVDFSFCSSKAVGYAMALAKQFQAGLLLLHVIPTQYPVGTYDYIDYGQITDALQKSGRKELDNMAKAISAAGVHVDTVMVHGRPATEIVEAAARFKSDWIVIATHGRTGLGRQILGSTTEEVVRHAGCSVLAVREAERDFVLSKES